MTEELIRCYRVLDLEPGGSLQVVKQAYRELVKVWHPDRFENDPQLQHKAQEKLKSINAAYRAILDHLETGTSAPKSETEESQKKQRVDEAFYRGGEAFYFGEGAQKDFNEAANCFLKSAQRGYAPAQDFLGLMYFRGEGVHKDKAVAAKWWLKAAEQGHPTAQHSLGCLYKDDFGSNIFAKVVSNTVDWKVGDSKIEAYKWFNLAVTNGMASARAGMEEVSICMSQNQINEARTRASHFYPIYPQISTNQAIREWFGFYLAEIKRNERFTKWYGEVMSDLREHPDIEADIVEHLVRLLENEFFGKKGQQTQAFFQSVGSNWKEKFGKKPNRTDRARVISFAIKIEAWDAFSPEYICRKENILNYLWLKIFAGK